MERVIKNYLEQAKVGRKQSYQNLAVFPLLSPYSAIVTYITLDDAFTGGHIEIEELDESGSVPELKVNNKSSKMILILDGEELVGAKQNRIVKTYRTKRSRDLSIAYLAVLMFGMGLLQAYSVYVRDFVFIFGNSISMLSTGLLIVLWFKYRRGQRRPVLEES